MPRLVPFCAFTSSVLSTVLSGGVVDVRMPPRLSRSSYLMIVLRILMLLSSCLGSCLTRGVREANQQLLLWRKSLEGELRNVGLVVRV